MASPHARLCAIRQLLFETVIVALSISVIIGSVHIVPVPVHKLFKSKNCLFINQMPINLLFTYVTHASITTTGWIHNMHL